MKQKANKLLIDLEKLERKYQNRKKTMVSLNHISEIYFYEYYINRGEYECIEIPFSCKYNNLGKYYLEENRYEDAENVYLKAEKWNPVDLDTIFGICEVFKKKRDLEKVLEYTMKSYRFCVTRAMMAKYYRNIGFYYLEQYKPYLAKVFYEYSNLYYHSDTADMEIKYIKEALNFYLKPYPVEELIKRIKEKGFPLSPDKISVGLIYTAGKNEEKAGRFQLARECYEMVYDVTDDQEIKEKLDDM